ncbi:7tm 7 domain containing protein, partial [Asbolus verrucosus]
MWSDNIVATLKSVWILSQLFLMCPRAIDEKITKKKYFKSEKMLLFIYNIVAIFLSIYLICETCDFKILAKISIVTQLLDWFFNFSNNVSMLVIVFCAFVLVLRHHLNIINEIIIECIQEGRPNSSYEKKVENVEKLFEDIISIFTEFQSVFSIPLLVKIANQFIIFFSMLHFCIFGYVYDGNMINIQKFSDILLPLYLVVLSSIEVVVTVTVCQLTVLEYQRLKKLLYRIPISRNNFALMKKINLLSLRLSHIRFEFTAADFFAVNGTLIHT